MKFEVAFGKVEAELCCMRSGSSRVGNMKHYSCTRATLSCSRIFPTFVAACLQMPAAQLLPILASLLLSAPQADMSGLFSQAFPVLHSPCSVRRGDGT